MPKMGSWGPMPDAERRIPGLPFLSASLRTPTADVRSARPDVAAAGPLARRDGLMAERERLSGEIQYLDGHSIPRARETALNAAILAESRMTEGAHERAMALGAKVESMRAKSAGLTKELGDVKARLCEELMGIAASQKAGRAR